jgi:hypothetical protein
MSWILGLESHGASGVVWKSAYRGEALCRKFSLDTDCTTQVPGDKGKYTPDCNSYRSENHDDSARAFMLLRVRFRATCQERRLDLAGRQRDEVESRLGVPWQCLS